jgi:hypothetical protein
MDGGQRSQGQAARIRCRRAGPGRPIGQVVPFAPPGGQSNRRAWPPGTPAALRDQIAASIRSGLSPRSRLARIEVCQRRSQHLAARGEVRHIVRRRPGYPVAAR